MYIESNFVPFKCSAELRKNFPIFGIPHTIIINDNGEVIDRIAGYYPIDDFMEKLSFSVMGVERKLAKGKLLTLKDFQEAYEADPDDKELALIYAKKLFNSRDYKNAIPVYESITNITLENPSDEVWKYLNLATCYERVDRRNKPKEPNRKKVAKVSWDQVKTIAEDKMVDLNAFTTESAMKMVAGTARSMGITVTGKFPS